MSAPLACPRCGYQNQPGYQFCTNCGVSLGPAPAAAAPAAPYGPAAYGYPPPAANYDWARQVDRTKTGILMLLIGSLLSWAPYGISFIGYLLLVIGAILVILGRKAFGPAHTRYVLASIILFVVGCFVVLVVAVVALLPAIPSIINAGGVLTPTAEAATQSAGLAGLIAFAVVVGIAEVLFIYALQRQLGRLLLWAGYAANVVLNIAVYVVMNPVYNAVVTRADLDRALNAQLVYSLVAVIPALIFAAADYLAWSRINRREIPAPPTVPSAPWTPPMVAAPASPPAAPKPPQTPPPSGPAPPINPP